MIGKAFGTNLVMENNGNLPTSLGIVPLSSFNTLSQAMTCQLQSVHEWPVLNASKNFESKANVASESDFLQVLRSRPIQELLTWLQKLALTSDFHRQTS